MPVRTVDLALPRRHAAQEQIVREAARFNVLNCGRRFGKDTLGIDLLVEGALGGYPVAWFAPTYKNLVEDWRILSNLLAPITKRKSEQEMRLDLLGKGVIECWSLDSGNSARGRAYRRVIINEAAQVAGLEGTWNEVIRPTLTDYRGDGWFQSTPRGFNFFKVLYDRGQDPQRPEWRSWTFPTGANPYINKEEIEAARGELPDRVFRQEYLAEFMAGGGCLFDVDRIVEYKDGCRRPVETRLNGMVKIWQRPRVGAIYVAGADVAEGKDIGNDRYDYSGLAIYDFRTCQHVADLHGQWSTDEFAKLVAELCREYNDALLGVERNNHGHAVLSMLKTLGYGRLYYHNETNDLEQKQGKKKMVAGWPTTAKTKPLLEEELAALIKAGGILSYDTAFWDECLSYVRHGGGKTGAEEGLHDDRVVKHMIALQMRKHAGVMGTVPLSIGARWQS